MGNRIKHRIAAAFGDPKQAAKQGKKDRQDKNTG